LFILRNAGNIIPPYGASNGGESAAVEFAVTGLGVKHIIVCGHSKCGAMHGLINPDNLTHMPTVAQWLQHAATTKKILEERQEDASGEELLVEAAKVNALVQLDNLRTHPSVAARLAKHRLNLHAWVYQFETGEIFAFDSTSEHFAPLAISL
jgi:carbonic anhydrase